jgi:FkbM family methyltransferase
MENKRTTWHQADGDNTLALDWPINSESVVWEIGGYEGRWAAQMAEKFHPELWIFEPQIWAYHKMLERFEGDHKVHIFPYGLWTHDTTMTVREHDTDGASVIRQDGRVSEVCSFRDVFQISMNVDVGLMNIEGGEFILLPYMIGLGMMARFRYFWCQFHPGLIKDGDERAGLLYIGMAHTHRKIWDYYPTAVAWERK